MTDPAALVAAVPEPELHAWVLEQRWFASKSRDVAVLNVLERVVLREEAPLFVLALIEARFHTGTHELYQLPVGLRPEADGWTERVIAEVEGWTVYDGLADPELARELLQWMRSSSELTAGEGTVRFHWAEQAAGPDGAASGDVRPIGVEQSNSSIVFGEALILKAFRKVEPGVNPELELLRFLQRQGFRHIAPLVGWYWYGGRLMDSTLGTLQEFLADAREGWQLCLDDLEGFVERARELGRVTAEMHSVLGSDRGDPDFAPEEPSTESLSLLTATVDEEIERVFVDLDPEDPALEPIAGRGQDVRERLQVLSHIGAGGRAIRTHGDYHLGQTMLADRGWVILDFEGEPARSLTQRRRKRSPLRDVAGMLRSFAYAASAAGRLRGTAAPEGWEGRARAAFLDGYFDSVDGSLLPPGDDAINKLLSVFELEKAVYELRYELDNRPDWVAIPVAGIVRLLDGDA